MIPIIFWPRAYISKLFLNLFKFMEPGENFNDEIYENGMNHNDNDNYIENGEETMEQKDKRKRRSKNDPDGRAHKCDICGKTYLSRPALSQHIKTKHQDKMGEYKRGRGRPRKGENDIQNNIEKNKFENFFKVDLRKKPEDEPEFDYQENFKVAITSLYTTYEKVLDPNNKLENKIENHALLKITAKDASEVKTYDESIMLYLKETAECVSGTYYDFVCKFVILFRESYNQIKRKEIPSEENEFSSISPAEEVPDKCNDFISDFMEINNYFDLDSNEVIEIIQQFCHWLYEKTFTTSVLSLM